MNSGTGIFENGWTYAIIYLFWLVLCSKLLKNLPWYFSDFCRTTLKVMFAGTYMVCCIDQIGTTGKQSNVTEMPWGLILSILKFCGTSPSYRWTCIMVYIEMSSPVNGFSKSFSGFMIWRLETAITGHPAICIFFIILLKKVLITYALLLWYEVVFVCVFTVYGT